MLSITDIQLRQLATHFIGNKASGNELHLSKEPVDTDSAALKSILLQYFLTPFQEVASYHFWHPADLKLNEVQHFVSAIFTDPDTFMLQSCNLARHLYDVTDHPNIKEGELHVAYFTGCPVDGKITDAIGIYKTESKDTFLRLSETKTSFTFHPEEGINPAKMDKGCLIFNVQQAEGYRVHVIDKTNKGSEAQFWKDIFLKVRASADEYHTTEDFMKLTKDFILEQIPAEFEVGRVDQIDFLNKSVDYFKKNEQFSKADFEQEVFRQPELIESFRTYGEQFQNDYETRLDDGFDISGAAVKKQARVFKSVLKLDKNFHVYVHGDRDLIQKGYDEATGMNFYKIFFEEES